MLVVNFYGGAGAGKSTTAAGVFSRLKRDGYNCELITEYAKDLVYDKAWSELSDQIAIFAVQNHRLRRLRGKIDIVICEAPLLHNLVYGNESEAFRNLVWHEYNQYNNINFFLHRDDERWKKEGRLGDLYDAKLKDKEILRLIPYCIHVIVNIGAINFITSCVKAVYRRE